MGKNNQHTRKVGGKILSEGGEFPTPLSIRVPKVILGWNSLRWDSEQKQKRSATTDPEGIESFNFNRKELAGSANSPAVDLHANNGTRKRGNCPPARGVTQESRSAMDQGMSGGDEILSMGEISIDSYNSEEGRNKEGFTSEGAVILSVLSKRRGKCAWAEAASEK